jgi:hypothetical protein
MLRLVRLEPRELRLPPPLVGGGPARITRLPVEAERRQLRHLVVEDGAVYILHCRLLLLIRIPGKDQHQVRRNDSTAPSVATRTETHALVSPKARTSCHFAAHRARSLYLYTRYR